MLQFTLWTNDEQKNKKEQKLSYKILTRQFKPHFFSLNVNVRKTREINDIVNCVIINFNADKISNYVLIIYSVKINKYIT